MRYIKRLTLKLTNSCNLGSCRYCYTKAIKSQHAEGLNLKIYRDLIAHLLVDQKKGKIEQLSLTGGEPLLRNDVYDLVDFTLRNGVETRVNTNGTLVTFDSANRFVEIAKNGKAALEFQIGLDSTKREVHEYIRGPDSFSSTMSGIENILKARKNFNVKITLRYTLMKKPYMDNGIINYRNAEEDALDLLKFGSVIGVDKVKIRELLPTGYATLHDDLLLQPKTVASIQTLLVNAVRNHNVKLAISCPCYLNHFLSELEDMQGKVDISPCRCLDQYVSVDENGNVIGCVLLMNHPEQYLGNILKQDIIDIFDSQKAKDMLNERYSKGRDKLRCYAIDHCYDELKRSMRT